MELKGKPLVIIIEEQKDIFDFVKTIYNWSKDLVVCTNGKIILDSELKDLLQNKGVKFMEQRIKNLIGQNGLMEQIVFKNRETISRKDGFVLPQYIQSSDFGKHWVVKMILWVLPLTFLVERIFKEYI